MRGSIKKKNAGSLLDINLFEEQCMGEQRQKGEEDGVIGGRWKKELRATEEMKICLKQNKQNGKCKLPQPQTYKEFQNTLDKQKKSINKLKLLKEFLEKQQTLKKNKHIPTPSLTLALQPVNQHSPYISPIPKLTQIQQISPEQLRQSLTTRYEPKKKSLANILTYRKLSTEKKQNFQKTEIIPIRKQKKSLILSDYLFMENDERGLRKFDERLEEVRRKIQKIKKKKDHSLSQQKFEKYLHQENIPLKNTKYDIMATKRAIKFNTSTGFKLNALFDSSNQILKNSQEKLQKQTKLSNKIRTQVMNMTKNNIYMPVLLQKSTRI